MKRQGYDSQYCKLSCCSMAKSTDQHKGLKASVWLFPIVLLHVVCALPLRLKGIRGLLREASYCLKLLSM